MTSTTLPPGPSLSPIAAARAFRRDPIGLLSRAAEYGDVVHLDLGRFHAYLLNDPDHVRDVLTAGASAYGKGPTMQAAKRMLGEGLLTSEGEHHRRQRRLIQPAFHRDRMAGYAGVAVEHAVRTAERWSEGGTIDVHREMARLSLSVVTECLLGTDVETDEARAVGEALSTQLAQFGRIFSPLFPVLERLPLPANRRFLRSKRMLDTTIHRMIAERRANGARGGDVLSLLLGAEEDGAGMTDEQVRDEAMILFLAGHETTANALTWTWYLLSQNPGAEAELHRELDAKLGGPVLAFEDIARLPYTEMVLTESMRLFPPAWAIGRRALADGEVGGYVIPAGAVVVVSPYLVHHDHRWYEDPEAFRPERWTEEERGKRPRHAYFPFGMGSRMCVGEPFAWMEGILALATIARRWRLRLAPGARVELQPSVTLRPRHGMPMVVGRRR